MANRSFEVSMQFARMASDIAGQRGAPGSRARLVELAQASLGVGGAAIWHRAENGQLSLDACTRPDLSELIMDVSATAPGIVDECLSGRCHVSTEDFSVEQRWPAYVRRVMAETPIRSALALYLGVETRDVGALVLFSAKPFALSPEQTAMAGVFAPLAAVALEDASFVAKADNLAKAVDSNRRIGMAIGVLVARYDVGEDEAFGLLRSASQNRHVKLRDVAEQVIEARGLPDWNAYDGSDGADVSGMARSSGMARRSGMA